ncbi:MAG: FAD:protein FMN transferase [Fusicatenibacter sp.]|nr:FAD:protein FMN transferase [Lachnospiraceae bacterium]MDY2937499.1 FAD:protein FMN transferase [Fusicatenibacter sp.]
MKKTVPFIFLFSILFLLSGCSFLDFSFSGKAETENTDSEALSSEEKESRDIFAMDTFMTVTAYGSMANEAVEKAEQEITRLDQLLSTGDETSEVYRINQEGGGTLSEDTALLTEYSLSLYESTGGAFDFAIYPLMKAWGFTDGNYQVPTEQTIAELLPLTDVSLVHYENASKELSFEREGMQIDFGGIAKGYTSDRIMELYRSLGVTSGLVNLGGNVQVLGTKPDGTLWNVAIRSPESSDEYLGILKASDCAVITSGGYERYFEQDGKTYHHILDPATGYPASSGLISVTIVSQKGILSDGLSTALLVMGKDHAVSYWKNHSDEFDAILETEDGTLYITSGIEDLFEVQGNRKTIIINTKE